MHGGKIAVGLFFLFIYTFICAIKNAAKVVKPNDIRVNQNPFDGRRFDEDPEKIKKKASWQFRLAGLFFFMFVISINAMSMFGGGRPRGGHHANDNGETALMYAVKHGKSINYLKDLLFKGEQVNAKDNLGYTPLMYAAAWAGPDEMKFLIEMGAHIDDRDNSGDTAMFKAVKWVKPHNVFFLADRGVDLNSAGYANYTPLVAALNDWNIMQNSKANTDTSRLRARNRANYERDMARKENGLREIIHYLVAKNVDPTIKDSRGRDAIAHSQGTEFEALIKVLALKYTINSVNEKGIAEQADMVFEKVPVYGQE